MRKVGSYVYRNKPIGIGQYAAVYKGYHVKTKRPAAIKVYFNIKNGRKEARIMKRYRYHKHLARFRRFYVINGRGYTVMDWAFGRQLGTRRTKRWFGKKHSVRKSCLIVLRVLHAMRYLHSKNIQYRDVNPTNIIVKGRHLKIVDFGSSSEGQKNYVKLDLYLAGYLLYFLIHGNIRAYRASFPLLKPKVKNRRLQRILNKAMHRNAKYRYKSADQFIKDLTPLAQKKGNK